MIRNLALLMAITALAVYGAYIVLTRDDATTTARPAGPVLPGLARAVDTVSAVRVTGADDTLIADIRRDGDRWVVGNRHDYPADVATLREVVTALATAERLETKTSNPEFYARLGVRSVDNEAAEGVLVEVVHGDARSAIIVGHADARGGTATYVRPATEAQSLLVSGQISPPQETTEWLAADIARIAFERIQAVEVARAEGERYVLSRPDRNASHLQPQSLPDGRELSWAGAADSVGRALANLNLVDVSPRADTDIAADQAHVLTYRTFDGLVVEVTAIPSGATGEPPRLALDARFDAEQAARFAEADAESGGEDASAADNASDEIPEAVAPAVDAEAEARRLEARWSPWLFEIDPSVFSRLDRTLEDFLSPRDGDAQTDEASP